MKLFKSISPLWFPHTSFDNLKPDWRLRIERSWLATPGRLCLWSAETMETDFSTNICISNSNHHPASLYILWQFECQTYPSVDIDSQSSQLETLVSHCTQQKKCGAEINKFIIYICRATFCRAILSGNWVAWAVDCSRASFKMIMFLAFKQYCLSR